MSVDWGRRIEFEVRVLFFGRKGGLIALKRGV